MRMKRSKSEKRLNARLDKFQKDMGNPNIYGKVKRTWHRPGSNKK